MTTAHARSPLSTILRSHANPRDVVLWYGSDVYEGLDGGYTFDGAVLRDPDGDVIEFSAEPERSCKGAGADREGARRTGIKA